MKKLNIILFSAILFLSYCTKPQDTPNNSNNNTFEDYIGTWSRSFEVTNTTQTATYIMSKNSIEYKLSGGIFSTNYTIQKDSYNTAKRQWVGHTAEGKYYVLFFKEVKDNKLTLYKKPVATKAEGESSATPTDTDTDNHGWNTYDKQ